MAAIDGKKELANVTIEDGDRFAVPLEILATRPKRTIVRIARITGEVYRARPAGTACVIDGRAKET